MYATITDLSSCCLVAFKVVCDWLSCAEPEPNQWQDNRSVGQVRTRQVQAAKHDPWQDLEALGPRPRRNARHR